MERRPSRLTQAFVNAVETPGRYSDGRRAFGLTLLVKPLKDGSDVSKTYSQRLTMPNGKQKQIGLGSHPLTTLKMAREAAFANAQANRQAKSSTVSSSLLAALNGTPTPVQATPLAPTPVAMPTPLVASVTMDAPTFAEVAQMAIEALTPTWKGSNTLKMWQSQLRHAYPKIGDLPVNRIESKDIVKVLSPIWTTKHATANQLKMKLSTIFDHAIAHGWIEINPVVRATLALPKSKKHRPENHEALRYGDVAEAVATISANTTAHYATRDSLLLTILTATRRDEVRHADWNEIDLDNALWTIPAERMKSGVQHRIPLSRQALELLERQPTRNGIIFTTKKGKTLSTYTCLAFLKKQGIKSTLHGFRSSFRTWAEDLTDATHTAKEMSLAHKTGSRVEQPYQRSDVLDLRRPLLQDWADYIMPMP